MQPRVEKLQCPFNEKVTCSRLECTAFPYAVVFKNHTTIQERLEYAPRKPKVDNPSWCHILEDTVLEIYTNTRRMRLDEQPPHTVHCRGVVAKGNRR